MASAKLKTLSSQWIANNPFSSRRGSFSVTSTRSLYLPTRQVLFQKVLQTYTALTNSSQQPTQSSFLTTLSSCAKLESLEFRKSVHTSIMKKEFESDPLIHRSLIHFYTKCKCMSSARTLFESSLKSNSLPLDISSLTTLIGGYVNVGLYEETLHMFDEMRSEFVLDELAYVTVLNAFVNTYKF